MTDVAHRVNLGAPGIGADPEEVAGDAPLDGGVQQLPGLVLVHEQDDGLRLVVAQKPVHHLQVSLLLKPPKNTRN